MTANILIACIETRRPPAALRAFEELDVHIEHVIGFDSPKEKSLFRSADAIINELHPVTRDMLVEMANCRIIACASTGYDYVDHVNAAKHGIWVSNCPGYCTDEVATHTIALLLSQLRRIPQSRQQVRDGVWDPRSVRPLQHPRTQTVGIIGWGRIGKLVSTKAQALGFNIIANDPYVDPKQMLDAGVRPTDKETLMKQADYVTLHTPLNDETRGMINADLLSLARPSAYLINTSRGPIVDESALLEAVQQNRLSGAALDVLVTEPPSPDHPFLRDERFVVTPHAAWCSEESDAAVWEWAAGNVAAVLKGNAPRDAVNHVVSAQ